MRGTKVGNLGGRPLGGRRGSLCAALLALLVTAAWTPSVASAAKLPDLKVKEIGSRANTVKAGAGLRVKDTTKNVGRAKARASRTGYYLSKDTKKGRSDISLSGKRRVGPLAPGHKDSGSKRVEVPSSTSAGKYFLIGCADVKRDVRESNERNNCLATDRKLTVTKGLFPLPADPLKVSPTLQRSRSVTQPAYSFIDTTISATAADGTKFTLTVPKDALLSTTTITLTPVAAVGGNPLSRGLVGAVQIAPEGLMLNKPATLTIKPPSAPSSAQRTGFLFHAGGGDFHLFPVSGSGTLTMKLTHFSTPGVGLGTDADREMVADHPPARTQAQYEQLLAEAPPQDRLGKWVELSNAYFDDIVHPELVKAETDDSIAEQAIADAISWARQGALLGLEDDPGYKNRWNVFLDRLPRIIANAVDKAHARCVQNNKFEDAVRLGAFARFAALWGFQDLSLDAFQKARKCARFEVRFDSKITEQQHWTQPGGQTEAYDLDALFHVHSNLLIQWADPTLPEGNLAFTQFSYNSISQYPCSGGGTLYSHTQNAGTTPDKMRAVVELDLNPREVPPPGAKPPDPPQHLLHLLLGRPTETYKHWNTGCTSDTFPNSTDFKWYDDFSHLHQNEGGTALTIKIPASAQVGDLIYAKDYQRSTGTGGMASTKVTEDTTVELWHRPQQ